MGVTKWLKPSISVSRIGDSASVQAATRVNVEQANLNFSGYLPRIPAIGCRPGLEKRRKGCHVPYIAARQSHSTGP